MNVYLVHIWIYFSCPSFRENGTGVCPFSCGEEQPNNIGYYLVLLPFFKLIT
jgi:hypothetical protein